MDLHNFHQFIGPMLLKQGFRLFDDGGIIEISKIDDKSWSAFICGEELYQVFIFIDSEKILKYECSCLKNKELLCKHIVAALFRIQQLSGINEIFFNYSE